MGCPPITPFCTARSLRTSAATSSPTAGGSEVNRGSSIDGWGRSAIATLSVGDLDERDLPSPSELEAAAHVSVGGS
jgi:hypothetical protein